jgi:hypothetical protein
MSTRSGNGKPPVKTVGPAHLYRVRDHDRVDRCGTVGCDRVAAVGLARCGPCTLAYYEGQDDAGVRARAGRSLHDLNNKYRKALSTMRRLAMTGKTLYYDAKRAGIDDRCIHNLESYGYLRIIKYNDGNATPNRIVLLAPARRIPDAFGRETQQR